MVPSGRAGIVTVRCPLPSHGHPDRTPSMRLHLERDRWWCFACSPTDRDGTPKAGDVIEWVRQAENVDWRTAIEILDSGRPIANAWVGTIRYRPDRNTALGQAELPEPGTHPGRADPVRPRIGLDLLHRPPLPRPRRQLPGPPAY